MNILPKGIEKTISGLDTNQLLELNRIIRSRLDILALNFRVGDKVMFTTKNSGTFKGTLIKKNRKTAIILADPGSSSYRGGISTQWKVSTSILRAV